MRITNLKGKPTNYNDIYTKIKTKVSLIWTHLLHKWLSVCMSQATVTSAEEQRSPLNGLAPDHM